MFHEHKVWLTLVCQSVCLHVIVFFFRTLIIMAKMSLNFFFEMSVTKRRTHSLTPVTSAVCLYIFVNTYYDT